MMAFEVFATSPGAPFAITADTGRGFFAVQFHPEVHHTPKGAKLYENFVRLAGFTGDWTMGAYREDAIERIRAQVGDGQVICALSGGVDSSVAAVLIHGIERKWFVNMVGAEAWGIYYLSRWVPGLVRWVIDRDVWSHVRKEGVSV